MPSAYGTRSWKSTRSLTFKASYPFAGRSVFRLFLLRIFPLKNKAMHAMVVRVRGRYAILLGRDATYPAPVAFTLAHELGHVLLGHLGDAPALVDLRDPCDRYSVG